MKLLLLCLFTTVNCQIFDYLQSNLNIYANDFINKFSENDMLMIKNIATELIPESVNDLLNGAKCINELYLEEPDSKAIEMCFGTLKQIMIKIVIGSDERMCEKIKEKLYWNYLEKHIDDGTKMLIDTICQIEKCYKSIKRELKKPYFMKSIIRIQRRCFEIYKKLNNAVNVITI